MATPLLPDGSRINEGAVEELINLLVNAGAKGLFIGGSTGEGIPLSLEARRRLHKRSIELIGNRVPALIHVGSNTTEESVYLAEEAQKAGAHSIVAVTPYFYAIHDDALVDYYQAIYESAPDTPLLAYDIPHLAVNTISPKLLKRLVTSIPTLAGIKTSHMNAQHIRSLIDAAQDQLIVLAGNERIALGSLALGANGLISGLSTALPEPFVRLTDSFFSGDLESAQTQQRIINQLLDLIPSGARLGAIKWILDQRGIEAGPPVPPRPLPPVDWEPWSQITTLMTHSEKAMTP